MGDPVKQPRCDRATTSGSKMLLLDERRVPLTSWADLEVAILAASLHTIRDIIIIIFMPACR